MPNMTANEKKNAVYNKENVSTLISLTKRPTKYWKYLQELHKNSKLLNIHHTRVGKVSLKRLQ